jgi:pilus assembly protein CpaB
MNKRVMTILLCAFVVAAGCAYLVFRVVGNRIGMTHQQSTTRVIAAAEDIKLGTILTAGNLTTIEIAGSIPKGALLKAEDAIGRGVISDLYQGEPIVDNRLAPVGSGGGLAATIRQGMRACAVKVDEVVGVAGFVTPGMRVDVLISGNPPGLPNSSEGTEVKTLLQNIEVLSAGTDFQKDAGGKPQQVQVVNLLVSPEQAEVLSLASSQAHIQLVLRNPLDTQIVQIPGTAMSTLFADNKEVAPQRHSAAGSNGAMRTAPRFNSVEVFNGLQRSEQRFAAPGGK